MRKTLRFPDLLAAFVLAAAASASSAVAQDVRVINTPAEPVFNQPQSDTWPVVLTTKATYETDDLYVVAEFKNFVPEGHRLIVDFISVDGVEGANKRMWANFRSCEGVKPEGWGRVAVPLAYGGSILGTQSIWSGNVAMQTYLDYGCNALVTVWREYAGASGKAVVTLQGHLVKRSRLDPPTIPRE